MEKLIIEKYCYFEMQYCGYKMENYKKLINENLSNLLIDESMEKIAQWIQSYAKKNLY